MKDHTDAWEEKQKQYLTVAIICFIVGFIFFIKVISGEYIIKPFNLKVYENLVISSKPQFKETKGKNGRKWIEFKCINNKSNFEIGTFDYKCVNDDEIINEVKAGDTISISILKADIEDFDKDTSCEIHSLIRNNKDYLDIKCRNKADNNDGKLGFIILFAISIMTGIVYSFSEKPNFFNHVSPDIIIGIVVIILFFIYR